MTRAVDTPETHDDDLLGVCRIASELFEGWIWAYAVMGDGGPSVRHPADLADDAVEALERWAGDLLYEPDTGMSGAIDEMLGRRDIAIRSFVVADPGGRDVAIFGYGPEAAASEEVDVVIEAITRNLDVLSSQAQAGERSACPGR